MTTKKEEIAEDAVKELQNQLKDITKKMTDLSKEGGTLINEQKEKLNSQIQEHPLTALSIALGCGFLLGVLFKK